MRSVSRDKVTATTYVWEPASVVWKVLTDRDRHEQFFIAPCTALGRRRGARVAWGDRRRPVVTGTVEAYRPAEGRLVHTVSFAFTDEPPSVVRWDLEEQGEVTCVEVEHLVGPEQPQTAAVATGLWPLVLARFKTLLEVGEPMPWPTSHRVL